jgi:hypothetical protein
MSAPEIIMIVSWAVNLGINLAKDGQKKETKYSFLEAVIVTVILFFFFRWAGLFR